MSDFKKANSYLTSLIHHHGGSDDAKHKDLITKAKEGLVSSAKTDKELRAAASKLRVTEKRAGANTFESKAKKKVVDGMNKSSIGNHILGWFSPKHAR